MSDAREVALEVVRRALHEPGDRLELLVALQFCGMLKADALAELRASDPDANIVERILSVPPAPEPVYAAQPQVRVVSPHPEDWRAREFAREVTRATRTRRERVDPEIAMVRAATVVGRKRTGERSLFSMWMEKEIEWTPAVFGWTDDDPRADAMREQN